MKTQQAITILRQHNQCQRGGDAVEMPEPKEIVEAIDVAVRVMERCLAVRVLRNFSIGVEPFDSC